MTHCTFCGSPLVSTVANPTIALSSGTYHGRCYEKVRDQSGQEAEKKRLAAEAVAEEKESARAARAIALRAERGERMRRLSERRKAGSTPRAPG